MMVEYAVANPSSVENANIDLVFLLKLIFNCSACLIWHEPVRNEVSGGVTAACGGDLRYVGPYLRSPRLLGAEGECPALLSRYTTYTEVPAESECISDGIGLRIDLAVSTSSRTGMRQQIRADLSFRKPARKVFKESFFATVRQSLEMVLKHRSIESRTLDDHRVRETLGPPPAQECVRRRLVGSYSGGRSP